MSVTQAQRTSGTLTGSKIEAKALAQNIQIPIAQFREGRLPEQWDRLEAIQADELRNKLVDLDHAAHPGGLAVSGYAVEGSLRLDDTQWRNALRFDCMKFSDDLTMTNLEAPALAIQRSMVKGSIVLDHSRVQAAVDLSQTVSFGAIYAEHAAWGSFLANWSSFRGATRGHDPGVDHLDCSGGRHVESCAYRNVLDIRQAHVSGNFSVQRAEMHGDIQAIGARIGGHLNMSYSSIGQGHDDSVFSLNAAAVEGGLFLEETRIAGHMEIKRCEIGRGIEAGGGEFFRLTVVDSAVGGTIRLNNAVVGMPPVGMYGQNQNDGQDARGQQEHGHPPLSLHPHRSGIDLVGYALDLSHTKCEGDIDLGLAVIAGGLTATGLNVDRSLRMADITLVQHVQQEGQQPAASLPASKIRRLQLGAIDRIASVNLDRAAISYLEVPVGERPVGGKWSALRSLRNRNASNHLRNVIPVLFNTSVLSVDVLEERRGDNGPSSGRALPQVAVVKSWLAASEGINEAHTSSAQPWFELAQVYERRGHESEARDLRYIATGLVVSIQEPLGRLWGSITRRSVGYGLRPWRALGWLALLFAIGLQLALSFSGSFVATGNVAGSFTPWMYTLDQVIPAIETGQATDWRISGYPLVQAAFVALKALSWILLGLFVSGAAGLFKVRGM